MKQPRRHDDLKAKTPATSVRLRGVSSINGSSGPLIIVDGNIWEINTKNFDFSSANEVKVKLTELLNVNPEDIESINVLKGAAATDICGSKGSNGVIEIKTKLGTSGQFIYLQYPYMFKIPH